MPGALIFSELLLGFLRRTRPWRLLGVLLLEEFLARECLQLSHQRSAANTGVSRSSPFSRPLVAFLPEHPSKLPENDGWRPTNLFSFHQSPSSERKRDSWVASDYACLGLINMCISSAGVQLASKACVDHLNANEIFVPRDPFGQGLGGGNPTACCAAGGGGTRHTFPTRWACEGPCMTVGCLDDPDG